MSIVIGRKPGGSGGGGAPSGPAGGSLTGTYPNPTLAGLSVGSAEIQDAAVDTQQIADGAVNAAKVAADVATQAELDALGAWASYVPTLTAASGNPNLGATGTALARYALVGDLVQAQITLAFGGAGVAAGTGEYRVSLPVNFGASSLAAPFIGSAFLFDSSVSTGRIAMIRRRAGQNDVILWVDSATATVTNASPWTWADGDALFLTLAYEGA